MKTVGEMIADHHDDDALRRAVVDARQFADTELGRAFHSFKNALGAAWQKDCQDHISDKALRLAWAKAEEAERVLMTHMRRSLINNAN